VHTMDTPILWPLVIIISIVGIIFYNKLVGLRNRYRNSLAQIDVQLQRRHDLIPNLVESVKGYLAHESSVLEAVTNARQVAMSADKKLSNQTPEAMQISDLMNAENTLSGALMNLYAVQENYPDLKGDVSVSELMDELKHTENRIGFARQAYNDSVMVYRIGRESFPANMVASMFSFLDAPMWQLENKEAKQAPKVAF
jgi:LemA protein